MRARRLALTALGLAVVLVISLTRAADAAPGSLGFVRTTIGGPPGTNVSIEGVCIGATEGDAYLERPLVKGFDGSGALAQTNFYRDFDQSSGPSVAIGDVDGDGQNDIVTGSGRGVPGSVVVYAPDGTPKSAAFVYGQFGGGVNVAVGDVDNDGDNDIVTGARAGGGPHVLALAFDEDTNSWNVIRSFFAYGAGFTGGVNVAACDNAGVRVAVVR